MFSVLPVFDLFPAKSDDPNPSGPLEIVVRTGEVLDRSGTYRTGCPCGARTAIAHGMKAPVCPICGRACNWILAEEKAYSTRTHTPVRAREIRRTDARAQT